MPRLAFAALRAAAFALGAPAVALLAALVGVAAGFDFAWDAGLAFAVGLTARLACASVAGFGLWVVFALPVLTPALLALVPLLRAADLVFAMLSLSVSSPASATCLSSPISTIRNRMAVSEASGCSPR
ncbi:MAG TPA: hypothetical protein VE219_07065 [Candidatus Sulfotelmatobacter sp.]|nr:hypothetical protein [Candidatus Sulfotelmatobacter sp.]